MNTQISLNPSIIHLGIGQPDSELLPVSLFQNGALHWTDLAYGKQQGPSSFREPLAEWMSRQHQSEIQADNLLVTNGASNALYMICQQFTSPGDTVFVESPTYFIARQQFEEFGLNVVTVELEYDGVNLDDLQDKLEQYDAKFFYCIPTFHNPTGISYTAKKRQRLCQLAKQYECILVADEVYQYLYFDEAPPKPLALWDRDAPVLSIHTFSKILAPGLRLGWMLSFDGRLQTLTNSSLLKSGGGLAPVQSAWVKPLLETGQFDHYLTSLRQDYTSRKSALLESLSEVAENTLECSGGYFIWMKLPDRLTCDDIHETCQQAGVDFMPGPLFTSEPWAKRYIRLCFALYDVPELKKAAERLKNVIESRL